MNDEHNFHTGNCREQIAAILNQCQRLILSPDAEDENKCAGLLESANHLMRRIVNESGVADVH